MKHKTPIESNAHQALRKAAVEAGIAEADLRDFLWLINADDALTCFVQICENLYEILHLMGRYFLSYCIEHQIPVEQWRNIASWIIADADDLSREIGEQFNKRREQPDCEQSPDEGSKPSVFNPLVGRCATRNPLYTVLLNVLATEDVAEREQHFLMIAQLMVAHVHACRNYVPREAYENYAGNREIKGYPNSPYTAAFALRLLSTEDNLSNYTHTLNPKQSPRQFALAASVYESGQDEFSKRLAGYCRFIARAHGLLSWSGRRGHGGGRGRGGGRWVTGYVELGPGRTILPTEIGDSDDVNGDWGKQVVIQEPLENGAPLTKKRANQLLADDIPPFDLAGDDELYLSEYPCHETTRGIAGLIFAAEGQVRHVVMAHQMLPWDYGLLSVSELASLLAFSSKRFRALLRTRNWSEEEALQAETISLLHVSLWTGSTLERARKLLILPDDKDKAKRVNGELALYVRGKSVQGKQAQVVEWRIRSYFPSYRTRMNASAEVTRKRTAYMYVPDLAGGAQFVRHLLKRKEYRDQQNPFTRSAAEYGRALREMLKKVDSSGRITEQKVASYLFHRIARREGDITHAVAITGREHELAQARIYYTTYTLKVLRGAYVNALREIVPHVYRALGRKPPPDFAEAVDPVDIHVGSRLCPTRDAARKVVEKLQKAIKKEAQYRTWDELVTYHNYFTLYTVLMFGYATACRAIISPFLPTSEIDPVTGLSALADKDGPDHHKSRLVWVPPDVRKQIQNYESHTQVLLGALGDHLTKPDVDPENCFFLRKTGRGQFVPVAVRPATLSEQMKPFIGLPANVHRRFLRTELIESGCPCEVVDAFMGHWSRGEEPFGRFSSFSYCEHIMTLESHLVPLLEDLGWRSVESALTRK